ncbi:MAG: iron ABC transporter permease [Chlorobi bacterium]|nr:iron ABC transporter permease [Chlorobiota bacterium]
MSSPEDSIRRIIWPVIITLLILLILGDLLMGSVRLSAGEVWNSLTATFPADDTAATIIRQFRLPRVMTAVFAGMALSVSGLLMQTVFRNPLAGPYVLGISAGASLGVALVVLGFSSLFAFNKISLPGNSAMLLAAATGSILVLLLLLIVSARVKDIMTILILGVMFGSAVTALVAILQYFSNESMLKAFIIWTMGSLSSTTNQQVYLLAVMVILGLLVTAMMLKNLNILMLGEEMAVSMGMNLYLNRAVIFLVTGLLVGAVTAYCGPIGFIGIIVPHIARMMFNTSHVGRLFPGTIVLGAVILLAGDLVSHIPGKAAVLPINAVTAVLGVPVIMWMILRNRKLSALM